MEGIKEVVGRQVSFTLCTSTHVSCAVQRGWLLSLGSCNFHLLLRGSPTHKYILFCCSEYRNSAISTKRMFLFVHWLAKGLHPHNVPYNVKDQGRLRITDMCFIWGLTISFMVEERCCVLTLSMRERCVGQEATISGADIADLLEDHQNWCWCPLTAEERACQENSVRWNAWTWSLRPLSLVLWTLQGFFVVVPEF